MWGCGLAIGDCGLAIGDCGLAIADCRLRLNMQHSSKCKIVNFEFLFLNPQSPICNRLSSKQGRQPFAVTVIAGGDIIVVRGEGRPAQRGTDRSTVDSRLSTANS